MIGQYHEDLRYKPFSQALEKTSEPIDADEEDVMTIKV